MSHLTQAASLEQFRFLRATRRPPSTSTSAAAPPAKRPRVHSTRSPSPNTPSHPLANAPRANPTSHPAALHPHLLSTLQARHTAEHCAPCSHRCRPVVPLHSLGCRRGAEPTRDWCGGGVSERRSCRRRSSCRRSARAARSQSQELQAARSARYVCGAHSRSPTVRRRSNPQHTT
jgi:hypothetical protein